MIRIVVSLFVVAVALCAWIILGDRDRAEVAVPLPAPATVPAPDPVLPDVQVTRAAAIEALLPAAAPAEVAATVATTARPATDETDLRAMTSGVLAGLGVVASPDPVAADAMRDMTADALAGIQALTGQPAGTAAAPTTPLQDLVVQALREGQSDAYIDALLNEAASEGRVTVPEILVTADGRVDTHVLLASIVAEAQQAATGQAPAVPVIEPGAPGVEVRVVQRADQTEQYRFYTVQPGDSLGAIAIRFYGTAAEYGRIFDANRALLSSPDLIRQGQRLVIPDL